MPALDIAVVGLPPVGLADGNDVGGSGLCVGKST